MIFNTSSLKPGGVPAKVKKDFLATAHNNLMRVIVSLERLNHKYFVTADVCGIVKVWPSTQKTEEVITIDLEQAMAYNCMIELRGILP